MTALDDVQGLRAQGMTEDQIIQTLRQRGMKYKEIADAISQTAIRSAVEQPAEDPASYDSRGGSQMQASIMNQQAPAPGQEAPAPQQQYTMEPAPTQGQDFSYAAYEPQQSYQTGVSSEVIAEIAEQVTAERLSEIRKYLEKVVDLRTTFEAKIESMDERLKRIERTIDVLQTSVLRKVGDYVTNVEDLKNEVIETQKTFAKLAHTKHEKTAHAAHKHHHSKT